MNGSDAQQKRIFVTEILLDYQLPPKPQSKGCPCLAWNVGGTPVEHWAGGAGAQQSFDATPGGADASTLPSSGMLVGPSATWKPGMFSRKQNAAGIFRA